jgi:hypothetical protein
MTGYLQTIESAVGQTIGLIRENGQVEDCTVVPAASSAGVTPLATVFFVDKNTGSTAQDGSIANPFDTVQAALTAAAAAPGSSVGVLVAPGDYSAEVLTFSGPQSLQVSALWQTSQGFNGNGASPHIGPLTISGSSGVFLNGLESEGVDGGSGSVNLQNCTFLAGTITCNGGVVSGISTFFNGGVVLAGQNIRLQSCEIKNVTINAAGTLVEVTGSVWDTGSTVVFGGAPGSLRLDSLTNFYWTAMGGGATLTNGSVAVLV